MAVIKATTSSLAEAARFSAYALQDLSLMDHVRRQAAELLASAQREAEVIRAGAQQAVKQEAEKAAQEARAAADQKIRETAEAKAAEALRTLLPALQKSLREFQQARDAWLAHWEKNALALAGAIAARVIRRELAQRPEIPLQLLRESLTLAAGSPRLRLKLHPKDVQHLGPQAARLVAELAPAARAEIVAEDSVEQGGCVLESDFGTIDQQFSTQLARVLEELSPA